MHCRTVSPPTPSSSMCAVIQHLLAPVLPFPALLWWGYFSPLVYFGFIHLFLGCFLIFRSWGISNLLIQSNSDLFLLLGDYFLILSFCCDTSWLSKGEAKFILPDIIPVITEITKHKLKLYASNYLEWIKTMQIYLHNISKDGHLNCNLPSDDTKQDWPQEDAHVFLQLKNSINSEVISLINCYEFIKNWWTLKFLKFPCSRKDNLSNIHDVHKAF